MSLIVVSVFVLSGSIVLLAAWLRFACRAILKRSLEPDLSQQVARANRLMFLAIGEALATSPAEDTDCGGLVAQLERDYEALTYLLLNAITFQGDGRPRHERLLTLNFQFLRWWVRLQLLVNAHGCRHSLLEMVAILQHLSNLLGQRLAVMARLFGSAPAAEPASGWQPSTHLRWQESARGSWPRDSYAMVRRRRGHAAG
jgi:hypothetical protein